LPDKLSDNDYVILIKNTPYAKFYYDEPYRYKISKEQGDARMEDYNKTNEKQKQVNDAIIEKVERLIKENDIDTVIDSNEFDALPKKLRDQLVGYEHQHYTGQTTTLYRVKPVEYDTDTSKQKKEIIERVERLIKDNDINTDIDSNEFDVLPKNLRDQLVECKEIIYSGNSTTFYRVKPVEYDTDTLTKKEREVYKRIRNSDESFLITPQLYNKLPLRMQANFYETTYCNDIYYKRKYTSNCLPKSISEKEYDKLDEISKQYYIINVSIQANTNKCYVLKHPRLTKTQYLDKTLPLDIKLKYEETPSQRGRDREEFHYEKL
jgi:hypothetical protein